jgi:hypothetical protein
VLSVGKSITHALKLFFSRLYGQNICVGNLKDFIFIVSRVILFSPTGCFTLYQICHFFNNSNTNEDIATKFEQE